jgi:hypothetical protein
VSSPETRISDADRERSALALREHLVDGTLTLDEFAERLDAVYAARTRNELERVAADLPAAAAAPPRRRSPSRWIIAVMGGSDKRGRWRVAERVNAIALMGGCDIDLRAAELESPETVITCVAIMGGINVVVPEGIEVELSGFAFMGGNDSHVTEPAHRGAPFVRVRAFSLMGGVDVKTKPRRRRPLPPPTPPPPLPPPPRR